MVVRCSATLLGEEMPNLSRGRHKLEWEEEEMKQIVMCTRTGRIILDELTPDDKATLYTRCMHALLEAAGYEIRGYEDAKRIHGKSAASDRSDS